MSTESQRVEASPAAPSRGVLYVATDGIYAEAAVESARSVCEHSPNLSAHLFTSAATAERVRDEAAAIDLTLGVIEDPHRRSKVDYLPRTPFDRTLYLDSDTLVCSPIDDVFDLLDRFDVALAHAHRRDHTAKRTVWRYALPDAFPQFNGGVIAYRRTPEVLGFLGDWQKAYHAESFKKDQVTLQTLLWEGDLRIATLPPEYNLRFEKYLKVWDIDEARPRILHLRQLHLEPSWLERLLGRRRLPSLKRWYD